MIVVIKKEKYFQLYFVNSLPYEIVKCKGVEAGRTKFEKNSRDQCQKWETHVIGFCSM